MGSIQEHGNVECPHSMYVSLKGLVRSCARMFFNESRHTGIARQLEEGFMKVFSVMVLKEIDGEKPHTIFDLFSSLFVWNIFSTHLNCLPNLLVTLRLLFGHLFRPLFGSTIAVLFPWTHGNCTLWSIIFVRSECWYWKSVSISYEVSKTLFF